MKKIFYLFMALLISQQIFAQSTFRTPVNVVTGIANFSRQHSHLIVNGYPAFIYLNSSLDLMYVRATNAEGTTWGTPVTLEDRFNVGSDFQMAIIAGKPAVVYSGFNSPQYYVNYKSASDINGSAWNTTVTVFSPNSLYNNPSLLDVGGRPAVVFSDATNVYFSRATNDAGTSFSNSPVVVTSHSADLKAMKMVNGKPAIVLRNGSGYNLEYVIANDAVGSSWGTVIALEDYLQVAGFSFTVVNGYPAIAFSTGGNELAFIRANDVNGNTWGTHRILQSATSSTAVSSCSLEIVNGNPAIAYLTGNGLYYLRASDVSGNTWGSPLILEANGSGLAYAVSLTTIDNKASIAYANFTSSTAKYIQEACTPLATSPGNVDITWTGTFSTDWNDPCNWNPAWVPDLTNKDAIIPDVPNKPIIGLATIAEINSIRINANSSLTVNGTLNVRSVSTNTIAITLNGATLTNNGTIRVETASGNPVTGFAMVTQGSDVISIINNGTLTLKSTVDDISFGGSNSTVNLTNNSTGTINFKGTNDTRGIAFLGSNPRTFTNNGTLNFDLGTNWESMTMNAATVFTNTGTVNMNLSKGILGNGATINNNSCGKIIMASGSYLGVGTTNNSGLIQIMNNINNTGGTFTNSGILKYGSLTGTITNSGNASIVVNNTPTPIFTYGGTYNGTGASTVNGIYKEQAATNLAGTFTAPNTFEPDASLPAGTQTLYAKITPSGGACFYVVPFTYNYVAPPTITAGAVTNTTSCGGANGSIAFTTTNVPDGTYSLSFSTTGSSSPKDVMVNGGVFMLTGLSVGDYNNFSITVSGNAVSTGVLSPAKTVANPSPPTLVAGTAVNSTTCTGDGSIPFNSTNLPDGTYSLSFTATGVGATTSPKNVTVEGNAFTLSGLKAGTYSNFSVTRNGCTATLVTSRIISDPPAPATPNVGTITQPYLSTSTGSVLLSGLPSGSWIINPGNISGTGSSTTVTNLAAGTYNFTVTNSTDCVSAPTADVVINAPTSVFMVGNLVYNDINRNRVFDVGDVGIDGVIMNIYRDINNNNRLDVGDGTPVATTTTTTVATQAGTYLFEVVAGTYIVEVAASNFAVGGPLYNTGQPLVSSPTTSPPDPDFNNTDNDDNGHPVSGFGVATQAFNIAATINHVDFGFKTPTRVSISDFSVNEGNNSSVTIFNFSVTRSDNDEVFTLTVNTADGTAVSTSDYNTISNGTIFFAAGGSLTNIFVGSVNRDNVVELDETFNVNLSGAPTGIYIVDAQATGTIVNDDISTISINNPTVAETNTGTTTMTFDIQMSNPSDADVLVNYATVDNTATITDNDYTSTSGVLTFAAGQTTKQVSVTINGDCKFESNETLILRLSNLINNGRNIRFNGGGTTLDATGTIQNDDIAITVNAPTITQPTCDVASGTIIINATSSSAIEFSVDGGMNYQSSNTFSGLTSGTYNLTIRNTSNPACVISYASNPVVIDPQPTKPTVTITGATNLTCLVTSVSRTATGGGTYSWSNGLGTNATVSITSSGIYTVTVTNSNGCTATATTNVTLDNSVPNAGITGTTNLTCTTTSVIRTATGGGTYSWSNGLGTNASVSITSSGIYTVTVTNSNGCTATATTNVTLDNSVPNAGITGTTNLSCTTTSVIRTATGGGTYSWSNGLGTSATVNITSSGIYTVTVTNSNGCTATATTNVTLDNSVPNAGITGTENLSCTTTSVSRTATGGGTYSWSNGLGTSATVNITSSGIYTVTVTNSNGCTATATTNVTLDNSVPSAGITGTTSLTCTTTSVERTATGGGTYSWSSGLGTNATVSITSSGNYTVTVTNSNGCTATATTNVTLDSSVPNAGITGTTSLTCTTTSVSRTATGGGTYSWSNGLGTSATVNITSSGIYTVTVTNSNGCTATATTNVTLDSSVPNAGITGTTSLTCTTTSVSRTATGGGTYSWSNSLGTNATVNITSSGVYTVTVTNSNGCTATATTSVTIDNSVPSAGITGTTNLTCTTTSVERTATGGGTYSWSNGLGTNATVSITSSGIYTVTVTNSNGCTATATTNVTLDNSVPNAVITGTAN
ncbi:Calx-beta domain-containing protein, partial [Emticicia sp. W12TSBA100-4]|uniref:beta strand repeat-containing protein n=1 Tax=Emticicia sp. W12TSBA100-4 TaxID=3160965 RepID=UPI003305DC47